MLETEALLLGLLVIFAAGLTQSLTGFGFGLIATPLLTLFISPKLAPPIVLVNGIILNFLILSQSSGDPGQAVGPASRYPRGNPVTPEGLWRYLRIEILSSDQMPITVKALDGLTYILFDCTGGASENNRRVIGKDTGSNGGS